MFLLKTSQAAAICLIVKPETVGLLRIILPKVWNATGTPPACSRYHEYYSNKSRGMLQKGETDNVIPTIMKSEISSTIMIRRCGIPPISLNSPTMTTTHKSTPHRLLALIVE